MPAAGGGPARGEFVPPKPIRQLRNLTRYRKTQIQERRREVNRLHKALEDAGIKLGCVASDILGKSGRDMLDALVACTTDPNVLADLARRQMRKKIPLLQRRWRATSTPITGCGSGRSCATSTSSTSRSTSSRPRSRSRSALSAAVELIRTMTGFEQRSAECVIAEIGVDMSIFARKRDRTAARGRVST